MLVLYEIGTMWVPYPSGSCGGPNAIFHGRKEELMSQAEAVLRQEVPGSRNETSSSTRRGVRPMRMLAEALIRQLELSRQRDALGDTRGMASLGRETGCRC